MTATCQNEASVRYQQVGVLVYRSVTVSSTDRQGYAIQTQSRHEKQVRNRLLTIGVEPLFLFRKTMPSVARPQGVGNSAVDDVEVHLAGM